METWQTAAKKQPSDYKQVLKNEGADVIDMPAGSTDTRRTSRAQRDVFKKIQSQVTKEDLDRYIHLKSKDCQLAGKLAEADAIVNKWVSRDSDWSTSLARPDQVYKESLSHGKKDKESVQQQGMKLNSLIGFCYAGNKDLWREALEEGECWEDPDTKLWYRETHLKEKSATKSESKSGTRSWAIENQTAYTGMMLSIKEFEQDKCLWAKRASTAHTITAKRLNALKDKPIGDDDMKYLQESFDQCTRLQSACKKLATDVIRNSKGSDAAKSMARETISMSKELTAPLETLEELLITEISELTPTQVSTALQDAEERFSKILEQYKELIGVAKRANIQLSTDEKLAGKF